MNLISLTCFQVLFLFPLLFSAFYICYCKYFKAVEVLRSSYIVQRTNFSFRILKYLAFALFYLSFTYSNIFVRTLIDSSSNKLAFALQCSLSAIFFILISLGHIKMNKLFENEDLRKEKDTKEEDILSEYARNTFYQLIITFPTWLNLSICLPISQIKLVPCLVSIWTIGRISIYFDCIYTEEDTYSKGLIDNIPTIISMIYCFYNFNL